MIFGKFKYQVMYNVAIITEYLGSETDINIPDYMATYPVVILNSDTFRANSKLLSVSIPSSVVCIGDRAFSKCTSLVGISIPRSVIHIGMGAFDMCSHLRTIIIPPSVTQIGSNAFMSCPSLVTKVAKGSYAEKYCQQNQVTYQLLTEGELDLLYNGQ